MKDKITIYHNTRCSTSRKTLDLLKQKKNVEIEIVEYLKEVPSRAAFKKLLAKLHLKPHDVIRTKEALYREKLSGLNLNDEEWIDIMLENPVLIERPIVVKDNRAVIARPVERIEELFTKK